MVWLKNETEFRNLPGLRWRLNCDRQPIAYSIRRRLRRDHLYFHGRGILGIYYERATRNQARRASKWWKACCSKVLPELELIGDFDGIILFRPEKIADIPRAFFKSAKKSKASSENFKKPPGRCANSGLISQPGDEMEGGHGR